jgi:hypothetical protein
MTGSIIMPALGTVDGRDLSVDGAKLDAIEAGADVTDTANVTAAGALMDSEVDVDIKTLVLPASTTISTYGATLVDDLTAAAARTTLGLGSLATSNTTLGTLATSNATLGALGTANTVNLATQVAGTLDRDSFEGYNSGTGITVNNLTGAVTSNVVASSGAPNASITVNATGSAGSEPPGGRNSNSSWYEATVPNTEVWLYQPLLAGQVKGRLKRTGAGAFLSDTQSNSSNSGSTWTWSIIKFSV